jgi:hypothetical protein
MPKLLIRTIEIDLEPSLMPELFRDALGVAMNGHANGQAPVAAAELLKLPAPESNGTADTPPKSRTIPTVRRPRRKAAAAQVQVATDPTRKPARSGSITEKIEQCLERYGWLSVAAISQKCHLESKQVSMALYHQMRTENPRFKFDESDGTYNLSDPAQV